MGASEPPARRFAVLLETFDDYEFLVREFSAEVREATSPGEFPLVADVTVEFREPEDDEGG